MGEVWQGDGTEEEGSSKIAKTTKVINGEGQEGDKVSIEVSDEEGSVDLGCTTDELPLNASFMSSKKGVR